jgi:hypothetical protein
MAKGGKRTYTRDGNGRFASSSGGRSAKAPASKQLSKPKGTVDSPRGFSPKSSPLAKSKRQFIQASAKGKRGEVTAKLVADRRKLAQAKTGVSKASKAPASKQLSKPKGTVDSPRGFSPKSSPLAKSKRQSAQASYKRTTERLLAKRANERAGKKTLKDRILAPIARRIGKVKKMFGR